MSINDGVTLFLEMEKAEKEQKKSLKTFLITVFMLVVFTTIALPGIVTASFINSDVINGPIIEKNPSIALDVYGIEFNEEILKNEPDSKQWETTPSENNKITAYIEPLFSAEEIASGNSEEFNKTGNIEYKVYFSNGENRSKVYTNADVYMYISPGSTYTTYDKLKKEIVLKQDIIKQNTDFFDYYNSVMLFTELYLKEALPQNSKYSWETANDIAPNNPLTDSLNNLMTGKGKTNFTSEDKTGLYIPSYHPIQYHKMPEWETMYRLTNIGYIENSYFSNDFKNQKNISSIELERFYTQLMNIPNLYEETFELFYNPLKRGTNESEYYTINRILFIDQTLNQNNFSGYKNATGDIVGDGYNYFAIPTLIQNFYKAEDIASPLDIEYGFLQGAPPLYTEISLDKINKDVAYIIPLSSDKEEIYTYQNEIETYATYTLEKNANRLLQLENSNNSGFTSVNPTTANLNPNVEKIKSNVIEVRFSPKNDSDLWTKSINISEFKSLLNARFNPIWEDTIINGAPLTEAQFTTSELQKLLNEYWDWAESGDIGSGMTSKENAKALGKILIWTIYSWDSDSTTAFYKFLQDTSHKFGNTEKSGVSLFNHILDNIGDGDGGLVRGYNNHAARRLAFFSLWADNSPSLAAEGKRTLEIATQIQNYAKILSSNEDIKNKYNTSLIFDPSAYNQTDPKEIVRIYSIKSLLDALLKTSSTNDHIKESSFAAIIVSVIDLNSGISLNVLDKNATEGSLISVEENNDGGFFASLLKNLGLFLEKVLNIFIGELFYWMSDFLLKLGFNLFWNTATGTAKATGANPNVDGAVGYLNTVLDGGTGPNNYSSMEAGYIMLQNIALLMIVLVVMWYGFAAAVGDVSGGLIAQKELKDMFPRLVIAIAMIGFTVNGEIFSLSLTLSNIILWITDNLTLSILGTGVFENIDSLFNISQRMGAGQGLGSINFMAAIILFIFALVMVILFVAGAVLFIGRIILIWILVLMGPLAWMFYVNKATQNITVTWLKMLTQTITLQFFWIVMLMIFASVFSMDFTSILGTDGINNIDTDNPREIEVVSTVNPSSGMDGFYTALNTEENISQSWTDDTDNVTGKVSSVSPLYYDRQYLNQQKIVKSVYDMNVQKEGRFVSVNPSTGTDDLIATENTKNETTMTQVLDISLAGIVAGIFFFTLLKFTSRFASSAMMSGLNTVNAVGNGVKEQFNRASSIPQNAAKSVINKAAHPIKTSKQGYQAIKTGKQKADDVMNTVAQQGGVTEAIKNRVDATKQAIKDAPKGVIEAAQSRANMLKGNLGKGKENGKERLEAFAKGTLNADDEKKVTNIMRDMNLQETDYKKLKGVDRDKVDAAFRQELIKDAQKEEVDRRLLSSAGKTLGTLEREENRALQVGNQDKAKEIRSQIDSVAKAVESDYSAEKVEQYVKGHLAGNIPRDEKMEHMASMHVLANEGTMQHRKNADIRERDGITEVSRHVGAVERIDHVWEQIQNDPQKYLDAQVFKREQKVEQQKRVLSSASSTNAEKQKANETIQQLGQEIAHYSQPNAITSEQQKLFAARNASIAALKETVGGYGTIQIDGLSGAQLAARKDKLIAGVREKNAKESSFIPEHLSVETTVRSQGGSAEKEVQAFNAASAAASARHKRP